MSPYVVTTTRWAMQDSGDHDEVVSRRAVATLDEARTAAAGAVFDHIGTETNLGYETRPLITPTVVAEARELPESGGTVDLPDGTVIEVEQVEWLDLARQTNVGNGQLKELKPRILAAFNAAQEATR